MGSLRSRLVVVTAILVTLVLVGVSAVSYVSVASYLRDVAEARTRSAPLGRGDRVGPDDSGPDDSGPEGDAGPGRRDFDGTGPDDDIYVWTRRSDGTVTEQPAETDGGALVTLVFDVPDPLPAASDDPDGPATFRTVDSDAGPFLVKFSQFEDGTVLAVGVSIADQRALLRRLLITSTTVTLIAIVISSLVAAWVIRRGLRPLTKVAHAAHRITDGDLEHRLDTDGDPTEIREVAASLNTMLDRLHEALARSQADERRMRSFVADASHELRTPVAAIGAYAELFERGASERPDDLARSMQGIGRETRRAARLIDDLTTLARPLDGSTDRADVDLATVLSDAAETATAIDDRWPISVQVTVEPTVRGDQGALRRVVDNLLANVRTHTPPGTSCRLELGQDHDVVVVRAIDNGPGLAADQLERATDRFWRADPSRTRSTGGSGLGLAIVRTLVEGHGGSVRLTASSPPPGLTVEIRLPLGTAEPER